MCTSVAAACEVKATFDKGICGVEMTETYTVFTDEIYGCNWKSEDNSANFDFLCYHVPSDNYNVFGS
jgi:hypothetical protein